MYAGYQAGNVLFHMYYYVCDQVHKINISIAAPFLLAESKLDHLQLIDSRSPTIDLLNPIHKVVYNHGISISTTFERRSLDSANSSVNRSMVSGRGSNFELALRFSNSIDESGSSPIND